MKKGKLLTALLCLSVGCISPTVQAAKTSPKKENTSPKKHKVAPKHKITEKDIAECTSLLNKVAQKEMTKAATPVATPIPAPVNTNNTKIAEHLHKPADTQLFASDNPKDIANLTGKNVGLVPPPAVKPSTPATHVMPAPPTDAKLFASNSPATTPKPVVKPTALTTPKQVAKPNTKQPTETVKVSQPHIQLFAPNTPDLEHLEGKSASLENLQPSKSTKSATTEQQKPKKSTDSQKTKKPTEAQKTKKSTSKSKKKVNTTAASKTETKKKKS